MAEENPEVATGEATPLVENQTTPDIETTYYENYEQAQASGDAVLFDAETGQYYTVEAKEVPIPSTPELPSPDFDIPATTFTPPEGGEPTEFDAQGNVTVYKKDGVEYFSPYSTMWEKGYKTYEEYMSTGAIEELPEPWEAVDASK